MLCNLIEAYRGVYEHPVAMHYNKPFPHVDAPFQIDYAVFSNH